MFENLKIAYGHLSDWELKKSYWLFKLIGSPRLVAMGKWFTERAIKYNLPIWGILENTIYDHFCGGKTAKDALKKVHNLYKYKVYSILDYSVEGQQAESSFDHVKEELFKVIQVAKNEEAIPFVVFKPSGVGTYSIYEKVGTNTALNETEKEEWERVKRRYLEMCEKSMEHQVMIMVDAEETWIQDAVDELVFEMMQQFNKEDAYVFNTVQMYRTHRLEYLEKMYDRAKEAGVYYGVKLVRGAYMEKERNRASENGYPSPIQPNKEATDESYNAALLYMLQRPEVFRIFAGTHNEKSNELMAKFIEENHIVDKEHYWFGQLLGMSDNISFNLAHMGFNVAKYVPYGDVKLVIPYLLRRAEENTSVEGQSGRELQLLSKEMKRRKLEV